MSSTQGGETSMESSPGDDDDIDYLVKRCEELKKQYSDEEPQEVGTTPDTPPPVTPSPAKKVKKDKEPQQDPVTPIYIKSLPTKQMTGVDPSMTRLCATVAGKIYAPQNVITTKDDFVFSNEDISAEVLLYDNHRETFNVTNPAFMVLVSGETMILAWRGSTYMMDFISDVDFHVASSKRYKDVAKTVYVEGAYASMVETDLVNHEDFIVKKAQELNIKEIILTGHSLGGGLAQIAHLFLQGQLTHAGSALPWKVLDGQITIRTLAFEAPMTTVFIPKDNDEEENRKGKAFIEKCGANMCTFCFSMDCVPRAYGWPKFVIDLAENVLGTDKASILHPKALITKSITKKFVKPKIEQLGPLLKAMVEYRHIGRIIFYSDADADPVVYKDQRKDGCLGWGNLNNDAPPFCGLKYTRYKKHAIEAAYQNHMYIVDGPGLAFEALPSWTTGYDSSIEDVGWVGGSP